MSRRYCPDDCFARHQTAVVNDVPAFHRWRCCNQHGQCSILKLSQLEMLFAIEFAELIYDFGLFNNVDLFVLGLRRRV